VGAWGYGSGTPPAHGAPGRLPLHPFPSCPPLPARWPRADATTAPRSREHSAYAAALVVGSALAAAAAHPYPPAHPARAPVGATGWSHSPARVELVSWVLGGATRAESAASSLEGLSGTA